MKNFLTEWIDSELKEGGRCHGKMVNTRFPPEPNGYLHIGHAKSILLNFGLAKHYNGQCNLRFDDTNPVTEDTEYVDSIKEDVRWITTALDLPWCKDGKTEPWRDNLFYTSDYFDTLHKYAIELIKDGKAFVDSETQEQMREKREGNVVVGDPNSGGKNSSFRDRSVEENLKLFEEMTAGKHKEGTHVLRAKIDMKSNNMNMRDPPIYRIRHAHHHRTGDKWCVYPIYDFAHGQSDAIEHITHSICTLEFENHNELYQWFVNNIPSVPKDPVQKEFARLNLEGAVTSKRKLLKLVQEKKVIGWDDPRLLTIRGLRRRGVRPEGIKRFCDAVGVTTSDSLQTAEKLEDAFREDLDPIACRRMVVLRPLKIEVTTFEKDNEALTPVKNHPLDEKYGTREFGFSKHLYVERDDFMENPTDDKWFKLGKIGSEVKLKYGYVLKLEEIVKDDKGEVVLLKCSHDPATKDSMPSDRKIKGVIHWVNAAESVDCEVREINNLFLPTPEKGDYDFMDYLNPKSWVIHQGKAEHSIGLDKVKLEDRFQFERKGYFSPDLQCFAEIEKDKKLVFNLTVPMKQSAGQRNAEGTNSGSRKAEQEAARMEKERLKKVPHTEFFKVEKEFEGKYSKFDEDGIPTHDAEGEALKKSAVKKLKKDWEKQKKLHENYLKEQGA